MSIEDDIKIVLSAFDDLIPGDPSLALNRVCEAARLGAAVMGMSRGMSLNRTDCYVSLLWTVVRDGDDSAYCGSTPLEALKAAGVEG